jgi:glycosyltransferase involved in cell wall biosynthesis
VKSHQAAFVNVIGLKHLTRFLATFRFVFKWAFRHRHSRRVIFMHGAQSCKFWGALLGTFFYKAVRLPYLTDDLGLVSSWEGGLVATIRRLDERLIRAGMRRMSLIIAMTKELAEKWGPGVPKMVVPAILPEGVLPEGSIVAEREHYNILYSGGLEPHFGVRLLLDAFALSKAPHWRLIITGKGAISGEIEQRAIGDPRILFKGLVSFDELKAIYAQATVFVNPRASTDPRVRYCFPSKLVEQMSTGVPVISTILPCLTAGFKKNLVLFSPETPEKLLESLLHVEQLGPESRLSVGQEARAFVVRECSLDVVGASIKTKIMQCFEVTGAAATTIDEKSGVPYGIYS